MVEQLSSLEQLSLAELETACRQSTALYRRGEGAQSDPRFCLEIFRRALRLRAEESTDATSAASYDEDAWNVLVDIYTDFIKANINRQARHTEALDDLIQQVWLRFWRVARQGRLDFPSLDAALSYIKITTVTTLIESRRAFLERRREESLAYLNETTGTEPVAGTGNDPFTQHARKLFRDRCREVLTDPLEYRVFWMRYSMGIPPREIARQLADEGVMIRERKPNARVVSDLLERSFKRLKLDPEIRDLLRND